MEKSPPRVPYVVKIRALVKERVQRYCAEHRLTQGEFVEQALEAHLEQAALREPPTPPPTPRDPAAENLTSFLARPRRP